MPICLMTIQSYNRAEKNDFQLVKICTIGNQDLFMMVTASWLQMITFATFLEGFWQ